MKKLVLALVCLVSVAFFASCKKTVEHPEPAIQVLTTEGYLQNGDVVNVTSEELAMLFGFKMDANTETNKDLAKLTVNVEKFDVNGASVQKTVWTDQVLTGKSYTYIDTIFFQLEAKDTELGSCVITAVVTDAAGETATATITASMIEPEAPLTVGDFDWYRLGNEQSGLAEYGLYWYQNAKSPFAQIKPLDGVVLYKFDNSSIWDEVTTATQKTAVFADGATTASMYNGVDVNANATYHDVIGTRMADGTLHLLLVESCVIGAQQSAGRPIHIYGKAK